MKKEKINQTAIRDGDFIFTRSVFPMGFLTKAFTGGPELHVGQAIWIEDKQQFYMAEMIGDLKDDNDLEINPLSRLEGYGLLRPRVVRVMRSSAYDDPEVRNNFRRRVMIQRASYDFGECVALALDAPRLNGKGLICSGFCFLNGLKDGIRWGQNLLDLPYAPSPHQLAEDPAIKDIIWKL